MALFVADHLFVCLENIADRRIDRNRRHKLNIDPPFASRQEAAQRDNQNIDYQIRASWMQDGREVSQERTVTVTPGQATVMVDFTR